MNQANKQAAKVALVTGAARRIGAAIIKKLHQAGFKVVIHCNHSLAIAKALAHDLNQQCPDSAYVLQKELTAANAASELITSVIAWAGRFDLLVNNASLFVRSDCTTFDETVWDSLFTVNVKVPFLLSLAARPHLTTQEGCIVNITDIHADKPLKDYAIYCQSKAALLMQTKALAREFAPQIRVNAIAPGAIAWPEDNNMLSMETQQQIIAKTPLKRHGDPEYIAQMVLALATNPFITGQIVNVDGGRSIV
ncbi:pteridine reductase [Legionella tunisiensis]|uniref:pteridine reductase n=1 Tax=Legionella tunisiensis TaxID=1034944 RepID=UPI000474E034|nr:pteridine reductase [Legionella tunisiensis]